MPSLNLQILIAACLGVAIGWLTGTLPADAPVREGVLYASTLLGSIFIGLLKMVLIPLIFTSIVVGVANLQAHHQVHRVWGGALVYFTLTTSAAMLVALVAANLFAGRGAVAGPVRRGDERLRGAPADAARVLPALLRQPVPESLRRAGQRQHPGRRGVRHVHRHRPGGRRRPLPQYPRGAAGISRADDAHHRLDHAPGAAGHPRPADQAGGRAGCGAAQCGGRLYRAGVRHHAVPRHRGAAGHSLSHDRQVAAVVLPRHPRGADHGVRHQLQRGDVADLPALRGGTTSRCDPASPASCCRWAQP